MGPGSVCVASKIIGLDAIAEKRFAGLFGSYSCGHNCSRATATREDVQWGVAAWLFDMVGCSSQELAASMSFDKLMH
jgi:hypothetical protein